VLQGKSQKEGKMFKNLSGRSREANGCMLKILALWKVRLRRTFLAHANLNALETGSLWKVRRRRSRARTGVE
jgi:hypothetical protein